MHDEDARMLKHWQQQLHELRKGDTTPENAALRTQCSREIDVIEERMKRNSWGVTPKLGDMAFEVMHRSILRLHHDHEPIAKARAAWTVWTMRGTRMSYDYMVYYDQQRTIIGR
jgi:hypothetical protein